MEFSVRFDVSSVLFVSRYSESPAFFSFLPVTDITTIDSIEGEMFNHLIESSNWQTYKRIGFLFYERKRVVEIRFTQRFAVHMFHQLMRPQMLSRLWVIMAFLKGSSSDNLYGHMFPLSVCWSRSWFCSYKSMPGCAVFLLYYNNKPTDTISYLSMNDVSFIINIISTITHCCCCCFFLNLFKWRVLTIKAMMY